MKVHGNHITAGGGYGGDHSTALPRLQFRERPPTPPSPTRLRFPSEIPADAVRPEKRKGSSRKGLVYGPRPDDWENPLTLDSKKVGEIVSLYESGMSISKVAEKTGHAKSTVLRHLHKSNVEIRGSKKSLDVEKIKADLAAGKSLRSVSAAFGVAPSTIKRRLEQEA